MDKKHGKRSSSSSVKCSFVSDKYKLGRRILLIGWYCVRTRPGSASHHTLSRSEKIEMAKKRAGNALCNSLMKREEGRKAPFSQVEIQDR